MGWPLRLYPSPQPSSPSLQNTAAIIILAMGAFEEEHAFNIERVSPIWLVTALCVVPFGIYYLLNFLSPLVHRLTAMRISAVRLSSSFWPVRAG